MSDGIAKAHPHTAVLDGEEAQDPTGIANLFGKFFGSVYTTSSDNQLSDFEISRTTTDQISSEVSNEEVAKLIRELDINKGAEPDGLPPRFYKLTTTPYPSH